MSILLNNIEIIGSNMVENHKINNNNIKIILKKNIERKYYNSFGITMNVNFIYRYFNILNNKNYILSFNFEINEISDIKIYNGYKWIKFNNKDNKGEFKEILKFNFHKKWRIRFDKQIDFKINNLQILLENNLLKPKKFLILGVSEKWINNEDNKNIINSMADNYFYNIYKKISKNYFTLFISTNQKCDDINKLIGLPNFEHCLDLSQRGLYKKSDDFLKLLRKKVKNKLCCICDHNNYLEYNKPEINYLFYTLPNKDIYHSRYIGPGCDHELFFINKLNDKFIILIDDCYYDPLINSCEKTPEVLNKCISFLKNNKNIEIIRLGYKDKQSNFIDPYKNKINNYTVIEQSLSITEKAKLHNKANIWWGTHSESFGLEYLESAMSGCLLVYKKGFINKFYDKFYTYQYDNINNINLNDIIKYNNYKEQRNIALNYTWDNLINNIKKYI